MDFLLVLISILMITVLIVVHEFGHFLAAKYYGFHTPVFGIGLPFGPSIDLFKKWNTQFKFYFALIGGFVAIPELGDETDPELLKKYNFDKPLREFSVGKRAVVASGGIVFNIIFAFLLAIVMSLTVGLPTAIPSNQISAFSGANSLAEKSGIKAGDQIIQVNEIKISSGIELQQAIKKLKDQKILLHILRPLPNKDKKSPIEYQDLEIEIFSPGSLGVVLGHQKQYQKSANNILDSIWSAFIFTAQTLVAMFISVIGIFYTLVQKILALFMPNIAPSSMSLNEVKGIVGIVQIISQDIKTNAFMLLEFAYLLSLNLAVINLLPIPALDGGHLAFMAYEAIMKRKPPERIQETAIQVGFIFLLSIILITTLNDLKNWIFG
jgi:membrane-associated protease RseP (regulator of RpoE activity)